MYVFFFFFFFKQKTAYEMRISDWSSDVCSSDLTHFEITELPESTERLRTEIREFLAETLIDYPITERMRSWMGFDAGFTKKLADKGWHGITWPKEYGGQRRDGFSSIVRVEELPAAVERSWDGSRVGERSVSTVRSR